jgi:hypothetical protein
LETNYKFTSWTEVFVLSFRLSKSSFLLYQSCPLKFKFLYIDRLKEPETKWSKCANLGTDIHKNIENFYVNIKYKEIDFLNVDSDKIEKKKIIDFPETKDKHMLNFYEFVNELYDKSDKHFIPIAQEVDYENTELNIHGIIDAVFKHYKDDGIIICDWKSGKYKSEDDMRKELAHYVLCWNGSTTGRIIGKAKYWAMYFTQFHKLFFEEIDYDFVEKIRKEILETKTLIDYGLFNKPMYYWNKLPCNWCGFKGVNCEGVKKNVTKNS